LTQKELPGRVGQKDASACEVVQTIPTIGFNVETAPASFDEIYGKDVSVSPMRGRVVFQECTTFFVAQPRPSLMTSHSVFMFTSCAPAAKKREILTTWDGAKNPSVNHGIFPSPTLSGFCR